MQQILVKRYDDGQQYATVNGTHYHIDTAPEVIEALEYARANRYRVRIFMGYTESYIARSGQPDKEKEIGQAWPEENFVIGRIGRTTGRHSPILVHNARSMGGGLISSDCIVAIAINGRWLYRHKKFTPGNWAAIPLMPRDDEAAAEYPYAAYHNGKLHARFKTNAQAQRYVAFMKGERFAR